MVQAFQASKLFDVSGKVVLVTGGAQGLGRMISEGFVQAGAKVYITSRKVVTCHCVFPPDRVRVRPEEGRTDEAGKVHGRADYRGVEGA
jgi:NAD(P)-dependent dehydrogenase (short-subunit alcohol dehydrogenase family)